MIDGKVCILRMSTGEVVDRYFEHKCEVTALDYDGGRNLCTGGADGTLNIYAVTLASPSPQAPTDNVPTASRYIFVQN